MGSQNYFEKYGSQKSVSTSIDSHARDGEVTSPSLVLSILKAQPGYQPVDGNVNSVPGYSQRIASPSIYEPESGRDTQEDTTKRAQENTLEVQMQELKLIYRYYGCIPT